MKKITSLLFTSLCIATFLHAQNVTTVDNSIGANAQFNDLQRAISAATAGDIIYVHPSVISYGNISVDRSITLIGFSHSDPSKETIISNIDFIDNASNSSVSGFNIPGDMEFTNASPISDVIIENSIVGRVFFRSAGVDNIVFRGNIIDELGEGSSLSNFDNYTNALITNNILRFLGLKNNQSITIKNNLFLTNANNPVVNGLDTAGTIKVQNCILYYSQGSTPDPNAAGVEYENCLSYNRGSGNTIALTGANNLDNQDPLFIEDNNNLAFDPTLDDFELQVGSPALGVGVNGEDLGLFDGGSFIFNNFGFTNGIPTLNIKAISTTVAPGQNLNVIINTANN